MGERDPRRRILAAIVLVGAGWGMGMFAGRMSAWIVPVGEDHTAARLAAIEQTLTRMAPPTLAAPAPRRTDGDAAPPAPASGPEPAKQEGATKEAAASVPAAKADADTRDAAAPDDAQKADRPPDGAGQRDAVVLVNPDWTQAKDRERPIDRVRDRDPGAEREPVGREPPGDERGIAECERRYSSFRRSDGTYQPYGRATREPCPFLR